MLPLLGDLESSLIIRNEKKPEPPVGRRKGGDRGGDRGGVDVNIIKNHQKSERSPTLKLMMKAINGVHGTAFISVDDVVDAVSPGTAQNDALVTLIALITLITSTGHPFRVSFRSLSAS